MQHWCALIWLSAQKYTRPSPRNCALTARHRVWYVEESEHKRSDLWPTRYRKEPQFIALPTCYSTVQYSTVVLPLGRGAYRLVRLERPKKLGGMGPAMSELLMSLQALPRTTAQRGVPQRHCTERRAPASLYRESHPSVIVQRGAPQHHSTRRGAAERDTLPLSCGTPSLPSDMVRGQGGQGVR